MIVAAAQPKPHKQDIVANLKEHYRLIEQAANSGADLILFPEMSVTGYEREKARNVAFSDEDARLDKLRWLSVKYRIIIVVGAPISLDNEIYIGSFIFCPNNSTKIYTKQYLHSGEESFFKSSFDYNPIINYKEEKIALAICADIKHPKHVQAAAKNGATLYLPSIFYSQAGIHEAHETLAKYAKDYNLNILMSNFCGKSFGIKAGGGSGFWTHEGIRVSSLSKDEAGLLLIEKVEDTWEQKPLVKEPDLAELK